MLKTAQSWETTVSSQVSSNATLTWSASTRPKLMPASDARASISAAPPGTLTVSVSNQVSLTTVWPAPSSAAARAPRSEEHTSELQSRENLVCRLLLEKKKEMD